MADIAPPPGFVETCTVENLETPRRACQACDAWFEARDICVQRLRPQGWSKMCQNGGASTWTEVWCRTREAGREPSEGGTVSGLATSSAARTRGCASAALGTGGLLLLGSWAHRRRRPVPADAQPQRRVS